MSFQYPPIKKGINEDDYSKHNLCNPSHGLEKSSGIMTSCVVCNSMINGDCLKCKHCGLKIHESCRQKFVIPCFEEGNGTFQTDNLVNKQHCVELTSFSSFTYCQVCNDLLVGLSEQGQRCVYCGMTCHTKCLKKINEDCKPYKGETNFSHCFRKGVAPREKCDGCNSSISSGYTYAIQCAWCGFCCHQSCIDKAPHHCCYGYLSHVIIPPDYIGDDETVKYIEGYVPHVVVVNPKSGGKTGLDVMNHCKRLLNPAQVFNVFNGWDLVFNFVKNYKDFVIISAGGDGTIGWTMNECRKRNQDPQIAIMPLGTGNDLANSFGWGKTFDGKFETVKNCLFSIQSCVEMKLDRWKVSGDLEKEILFNNYFSFGIDADIVSDFHSQREANPEKFDSALKNKMTYGKTFFTNLKPETKLCDAIDVFDGEVKFDISEVVGVCFLNTPFYAGGTKPWGEVSDLKRKYGWTDQRMDDKKFEVFGFADSMSVVKTMTGITPHKIAQLRSVTFIVKSDQINCQCDGEPIVVKKGKYEITFDSQNRLLRKLQ